MGGFLSRLIRFEDLSPKDIVIVVIGPSGSGKSTFINTATGVSDLEVAKGLEPCTKQVAFMRCDVGIGRPIVFVDTHPFPNPDEKLEDSERAVQRQIREWLKKAFGKPIHVSGILYLYNSSDNRMTHPPAIHFKTFQNLCGDDFHHHVLLVMTMWEKVKPDQREARQKTLTRNWGKNSQVVPHLGTKESAWDIVKTLIGDYRGFYPPELLTKPTSKLVGAGLAVQRGVQELLDKREKSLRHLMKSQPSDGTLESATAAHTALKQDMENVLREDIACMNDIQALLRSGTSVVARMSYTPTSRLLPVQEAREPTPVTCDESSGHILSHDGGKNQEGIVSEIPKEAIDTGAGTTKMMLEEATTEQPNSTKDPEGTTDVAQRTYGSPQIGVEGSSDNDSEKPLDEDAARFPQIQNSLSRDGNSDPSRLQNFSSPMHDMAYIPWNFHPYHPWYAISPAMWAPPQAPPAVHCHININNSNTSNRDTEEDDDDSSEGIPDWHESISAADTGRRRIENNSQNNASCGSEPENSIQVPTRRRSALV